MENATLLLDVSTKSVADKRHLFHSHHTFVVKRQASKIAK